MRTKAEKAATHREWVRKNPEAARVIQQRTYYKRRDKILKQQKEYRERNPERVALSQKKKWLKAQYGLTPETKQQLFDEQKGLCYLCRQPLSSCEKSHVDHSHVTNEVRGLTHVICNVRLGVIETLLAEDKLTLDKMIQVAGYSRSPLSGDCAERNAHQPQ